MTTMRPASLDRTTARFTSIREWSSGSRNRRSTRCSTFTPSRTMRMRGRLTAIQLSHNSLAGEDDPEVLRQMLESLLPLEQAYAAVLDMEVPKPPPLRPSIGMVRRTQ